MIKNLDTIAAALGTTAEDFKKMYDDKEEKEIDISGLEIVKKDDLATRIANERKAAATASIEVTIKEARTKYGLDFTGKNIDSFAEAFKAKTLEEAKIAPDKKVAEVQKDFEAMKGNFEKVSGELAQVKQTFQEKENNFKIESTILGKLPKTNTIIPTEEIALIFKSKFNPKLDDKGSIVFHDSNGEVLKNKTTLSPLTMDEIVTEFQTPYIKPATGGGGGVDTPGQAKAGSFEAFNEEMEKAGNSTGSTKYNEEMKKRLADKTLVI